MIEAAAQRTHVSSFRCGSRMVRNPRRHACICIEACSGGFWGILRQGIRRVSFGKHVLALGFDGIQLFQRELAYRVKPTRGCKAIISGKLSVGPRTSQSYRRRVCLPCWTEADDESGLGAEAMYRHRGNWPRSNNGSVHSKHGVEAASIAMKTSIWGPVSAG